MLVRILPASASTCSSIGTCCCVTQLTSGKAREGKTAKLDDTRLNTEKGKALKSGNAEQTLCAMKTSACSREGEGKTISDSGLVQKGTEG